MAQHVWTLVRKLKPEHVDDHAGFVAAREVVEKELREIGVGGLLFSPAKRTRRRQLHRDREHLDRQIAACFSHPGADLKPPRIGMDDRATKWYRKRLSEDVEAWPLPPDEMIEEMHGHPVWELTEHRLLHQLETEWPTSPFPAPEGPGFPLDLVRRLYADIAPDDAAQLADDLDRAVGEYLKRTYPELADAASRQVVETIIRGSLPGHPPEGPAERDLHAARASLSASMWLRFWGGHGYALTHREIGG